MKESDLKKKQAELIRQRGGWARSIPGGPMSSGMPDVIFVYRGYGGGIETKLPGKENSLTKLQSQTLAAIRRAGGLSMVCTSVNHVERILNVIDAIKDRKRDN